MEATQVQQLKLNVTNINSFLKKSNKTYIGLKKQNSTLLSNQIQRRKQEAKEKKIETRRTTGFGLGKVGDKIASTGGSIFDKILGFGSFILAGVLVNSLPEIIKTVRGVIDSIVEFVTPIQSAFNLIKAFMEGDFNKSEYDMDKKRVDDKLEELNKDGGLIDQIAEQTGILEPLVKALKPAIEQVRNVVGGKNKVLAVKSGKEGVKDLDTGEFTERQFTAGERKKFEQKRQDAAASSSESVAPSSGDNIPVSPGGSSGPSKKVSGSLTGTKEEKWAAVMQMAKNAGAKYPELVAAQFALESAWGTALAGKNNFFGIKAAPGESYTLSSTHEVYNGKTVYIDDKFKNFATPQDAINHLVNQWYKDYRGYSGVNNAPNANAAALKLKSEGYATDPIYAQSLQRLMGEYSNIRPKQSQPKITPKPRDKNNQASVLNTTMGEEGTTTFVLMRQQVVT